MLLKAKTQFEDKEEGFTLIEVLIVLVVIGIVISLALLGWRQHRIKAVDASVLHDIRSAASHMKADYIKNESLSLDLPEDFQRGTRSNELVVTVKGSCIEGTSPEYQGQIFWRYSLVDNLVTKEPCPPFGEEEGINPPPGEPELPPEHTPPPAEPELPDEAPSADPGPARIVVDPIYYTAHQGAGASRLRLLTTRGDLLVDNDFSCDSEVIIEGSVVALGDAYLTNDCIIHGDIWVQGNLSMDSKSQILGMAQVLGDVSFQSTNHIGGGVWTRGTFRSIDGRTNEQLLNTERIKVGIFTGSDEIKPYESAPFPTYLPDNINITWSNWLKQQADQTPGTPTWSPIYQGTGCTLSPNQSYSLPGPIIIHQDTIVDARNCSTASIGAGGNGVIKLYADLTLYVNSFDAPNGIRVESADGKKHAFNLITPAKTNPAKPDHTKNPEVIRIGNNSHFDPRIVTTFYSEGTVNVQGGTTFTGGIWAGKTGHMGLVTITPENN